MNHATDPDFQAYLEQSGVIDTLTRGLPSAFVEMLLVIVRALNTTQIGALTRVV